MKKIVAFGASSSLNSINKDLATYTASLVPEFKLPHLKKETYENSSR